MGCRDVRWVMRLGMKVGVAAHRTLQTDHIQEEFSLSPKNKGRPRKDFRGMWGTWGRRYDQICI